MRNVEHLQKQFRTGTRMFKLLRAFSDWIIQTSFIKFNGFLVCNGLNISVLTTYFLVVALVSRWA